MGIYEYSTIRIQRGGWPALAEDLAGIDEAARESGGSVFLLCAGLIGLGSDEGVLIRAWPGTASLERDSPMSMAVSGVVLEWRSETLTPTARPLDAEPPQEPGVYAHRWFWLKPEHLDEFLRLSEHGIWPYFESDDCRIVGLWRGADEDGLLRMLLITRYPNVAHWERTRLQSSDVPPGADEQLYRQAQEAGRSRAALTERSIVRLTRIILPSAS